MEFRFRLNKIITELGLNKTDFANSCGISRATVSTIISKGNSPSVDFVGKILDAYKNIDARWLLTGEGAMWLRDEQLQYSEGKFPGNNDALVSASEPVFNQPQYEVRQMVEPSKAPEIEIFYLKELLKQQAETITALQKLVAQYETKITNQ